MRFRSTSRTPWKALKKTTKKTRTAASMTFEDEPRPEPDHEDGAEHDARQRVDRLDVGPEHVGQEAHLAEQARRTRRRRATPSTKPSSASAHGDPDLQPQRAVGGAVPDPVAQPRDDPAGLAEEERVDDLPGGEQLPAADHQHQRSPPAPRRPAGAGGAPAAGRRWPPRSRRWPASPACRARPAWPRLAADVMTALPRARRCGAGVGALDFLAQRLPDLLVQLEEPGLEADLLDRAPRPGQVDVVDRLDRARARRSSPPPGRPGRWPPPGRG